MPAQSHDPQSLVRMVQEQGKPWRPGETSVSRLDERQKLLRLGARSELVQDFERRASLQRHAAARAATYPIRLALLQRPELH